MITLKQLEYLIALEQTHHFGKAASLCNISQPGLSTQIQLLEERLGILLLERRKKNILFTHSGQQVLTISKRMLNDANEIISLCKQDKEPLSEPLIMGIIPTIAPYLLPKIIPSLGNSFPKMKLYLKEEQTKQTLTQLNEGLIDIGLLALPINDERFVEYPIFKENFFVALPKTHSLINKKSIHPKDLDHKELLLLEEGHCLREQAINICEMPEYSPHGASFRATSLETLKQMVITGLGITLLPEMAIRKDEGYIVRPFKTPIPKRQVGFVWRRSDTRHKDLVKFAKIIREEVGKDTSVFE